MTRTIKVDKCSKKVGMRTSDETNDDADDLDAELEGLIRSARPALDPVVQIAWLMKLAWLQVCSSDSIRR